MRAKRARHSNGWPTSRVDEAGFLDGARIPFWILRHLMKPHTAGACYHVCCLLRVLVSLVTIMKRCDSALVPVPSAAPRRGVRGTTYGTSRSSVGTESIREHDSIVTGIGAEHADAT